MAAGLGFKDFTTGEVLTAADVDGYLMQGIWVFANSAARDAAVTSPQEGNFAFLKDTNTTTYYTGSAWTNLDTTGMVNPMTTTGDTIYSSSGSTPARLGIGTAGQVLTVNSGATAPEWATPSSGGGMTLIETLSCSGVSSVTTSTIPGTYKDLVIYGRGLTCASNLNLGVRFNGDTGSNYESRIISLSNNTVSGESGTAATSLDPLALANPSTDYDKVGVFNFYVPRYAQTEIKWTNWLAFGNATSISEISTRYGNGSWSNTAAITTITFRLTANFTAGSIYVYGVN